MREFLGGMKYNKFLSKLSNQVILPNQAASYYEAIMQCESRVNYWWDSSVHAQSGMARHSMWTRKRQTLLKSIAWPCSIVWICHFSIIRDKITEWARLLKHYWYEGFNWQSSAARKWDMKRIRPGRILTNSYMGSSYLYLVAPLDINIWASLWVWLRTSGLFCEYNFTRAGGKLN